MLGSLFMRGIFRGRCFSRWSEIVTLSYAAGAVLYKMTSATNPWWLLCCSVLAGGVCVLEQRRMAESGAWPSLGWMLLFPLTLLTGTQLGLLFFGSLFVVHGVFGLATGSIEIKGRVGPRRTYSGVAGRRWSITSILFGGAAAAAAFLPVQ